MGGVDPGPRKKLIAAAAWWVRGGGEFDQARADLRVFGASEESIEAELGPEEKGFDVWPENWAAVRAFLDVGTQWAVGMGGPTGLDYTRVRAALEMAGTEITPELFAKLRVLETAALAAMSGRGTPQESKKP